MEDVSEKIGLPFDLNNLGSVKRYLFDYPSIILNITNITYPLY